MLKIILAVFCQFCIYLAFFSLTYLFFVLKFDQHWSRLSVKTHQLSMHYIALSQMLFGMIPVQRSKTKMASSSMASSSMALSSMASSGMHNAIEQLCHSHVHVYKWITCFTMHNYVRQITWFNNVRLMLSENKNSKPITCAFTVPHIVQSPGEANKRLLD